MTKHSYTIVLLSDRNGMNSYSISLSSAVNRLILIFAIFAVAGAGLAFSSHDIRRKAEAIKALQQEKREIMNRIDALRPAGEFESYKSVLNIELPDMKHRGIGGDEFNLDLDAMDYESSRVSTAGTNIGLNRDEYFGLIAGVFMKYAELHHKVMSRQNRLDHLPSILPVNAPVLSDFGQRVSPFTGRKSFHRGIDIACETGTGIAAPAAGRIEDISTNSLWGLNVIIDHGYGIKTQFGHLSKVCVKKGDRVNRWDIIAESGQSGRATGPHLHYQIWLEGEPIDPALFVMNNDRESQL